MGVTTISLVTCSQSFCEFLVADQGNLGFELEADNAGGDALDLILRSSRFRSAMQIIAVSYYLLPS